MIDKSIKQLSIMLAKREVSSVELTEFYLARIKELDPALNSFITVTEEEAYLQAQEADKRIKNNGGTPLTGIPFAHKDIFCTDGVRTSCGSKMLDNFIAPYNAAVVEKMAAAGMVMLGKTNMDEFAMGSSNETSWYGEVNNPWDLKRIPGGSSGGSAAAVAARLAPIATGTDTGGSIRQPASLCGITGLKPTYGRVSRYGMIAFASSLDQAGHLAVSAEDAAMLLNEIAGFDPKDSTSVKVDVPDFTAELDNTLQGKVIGVPREFFGSGLDDKTGQVVKNALSEYEKMGAKIKEISLPNSKLSVPAYYVIAPAECSSNLARYDGVEFGYRCAGPKDLTDLYERTRQEGFGSEVKRRVMIGTYVLSAGYYDAYYIKAQKLRRLISSDFNRAFADVDVIMGPVSPHVATIKGEITEPVAMYLSDIYTIAVNLAGLPAISIPAGFSSGLPVGLQIIGNNFMEASVLNFAHRYQMQTDWHRKIPDL